MASPPAPPSSPPSPVSARNHEFPHSTSSEKALEKIGQALHGLAVVHSTCRIFCMPVNFNFLRSGGSREFIIVFLPESQNTTSDGDRSCLAQIVLLQICKSSSSEACGSAFRSPAQPGHDQGFSFHMLGWQQKVLWCSHIFLHSLIFWIENLFTSIDIYYFHPNLEISSNLGKFWCWFGFFIHFFGIFFLKNWCHLIIFGAI
jgi:hypothetical protein